MIYIGVGTDPFKQSGKGGWEEDGVQPQKNKQLEAQAQTPSLGRGIWVTGSHTALSQFLVPRRSSQATSLGIIGILDYSFHEKLILFGLLENEFCVYAHM